MVTLQFAAGEFLVLLVSIPLLILTHFYFLKFTKRKGMHFANFSTIKRVTGKKVLTKNLLILFLRMLSLTVLILALAQPTLYYEGEGQRSDYILAIDTSASMTADDLEPNRFEAARQAAIDFVDALNTSARIGVVSFAGTAQVEQIPTSDMDQVRAALNGLRVETSSGTDISTTLVTSTNLLLSSGRGRVVVLFTDGSATVGSFGGDLLEEGVKYAKERQVVVHTVAVGKLGTVPSGYLPRIYNVSAAFNDENLQFISDETSGKRLSAESNDQLRQAYLNLVEDSASTLQEVPFFLTLVVAAVLLLFIEWGLISTRFRIIP